MDNHTASVEVGFINSTFYNSLSKEYQKAVDEAAQYAYEQSDHIRLTMTDTITNKLKEKGMSIYTPTEAEYQQWHDTYRQASIDYLGEKVGKDFLNSFLDYYKSVK